MKLASTAFACLIALTLTACATSPWKANFEPEPGVAPLAPIPSDVVVVRPAPFERIDVALRAFERAWNERDTYGRTGPNVRSAPTPTALSRRSSCPAITTAGSCSGTRASPA